MSYRAENPASLPIPDFDYPHECAAIPLGKAGDAMAALSESRHVDHITIKFCTTRFWASENMSQCSTVIPRCRKITSHFHRESVTKYKIKKINMLSRASNAAHRSFQRRFPAGAAIVAIAAAGTFAARWPVS